MAKANGRNGAVPELPWSLHSEQACLGSGLISAKAAGRLPELLARDDFYRGQHRPIYDVLAGMTAAGTVPDVLTVEEELRRRGLLEAIGGAAYLNECIDAVPTAAHVDYYARVVRRAAKLRTLIDGAAEITKAGLEGEEDPEVLATRYARRFEALIRDGEPELDGVLTGPELLSLQLPEARWVVPGLILEGLVILAGKGKAGKSWMAYQIAAAVACGGVALGSIPVDEGRVLYLALEDSHRRLQDRLVRILDGAPAPEKLHVKNRWPRLRDGGLRDLVLWFKKYPDTRLIIIDTFAKVRSAGDTRANAYDEDYRAFGEVKALVDDHAAAAVVVHHFNKAKPTEDWVDQISGSIGVSGAADGILGFFRDRGKPTATLKSTGRDNEDEADRILAFTEHGGPWALVKAEDAQQLTLSRERREVLAVLEGFPGPMKQADLLRELGERFKVEKGAAKMRVTRLQAAGILASEAGLYWVSKNGPSEFSESRVTSVTCYRPETGGSCPEDPEDRQQVTRVTAETPVTAVTPKLRNEVWEAAAAAGFPAVAIGDGQSIAAGDLAWGLFFHGATEEALRRARDGLRRLEADG